MLQEAYDLAKSLYDSGDLSIDQASPILAALEQARRACEAITDGGGPCRYDHHGYCQAHGLQPKGECYMELARAALALLDTTPPAAGGVGEIGHHE